MVTCRTSTTKKSIMPYTTCCRKQNKPMETSRIANDLSNDGFDPEIQLSIAQETLRHLHDSVKDLPEIEREYADAVRGLANANSVIVKERLGKLAEEMKELKRELELAPDRIKEVENDVSRAALNDGAEVGLTLPDCHAQEAHFPFQAERTSKGLYCGGQSRRKGRPCSCGTGQWRGDIYQQRMCYREGGEDRAVNQKGRAAKGCGEMIKIWFRSEQG